MSTTTQAPAEQLPGFQHHFETVNGVRLHLVRGGQSTGETLILLAGFPESWYAWRKVMPLLAERFHVIAVDLPGQGDSDKPLGGYDTASIARSIHALLGQIGVTHYGLIGHDVGAWTSFPYALMFGSEMTGLVLLDAGIPGVTLPDMLPSAPETAWKTWHFPFHTLPDLPEALIQGRERIYLDWFLRRKTASPFSITDVDLDEYVRIFTLPGSLRAGLAFYRSADLSAQQNRELTKTGKINVPLLTLSADQGTVIDMAAPLRPFAGNIQSQTIARCGHFMPEEQPAAIAESILAFFSGNAKNP